MASPLSDAVLTPPDRLAMATLKSYEPGTSSQRVAQSKVAAFIRQQRQSISWWKRLAVAAGLAEAPRQGLYLVGPVGTGKTHLLASAYNALHPSIPCAFLHMSTVTRLKSRPDAFARALAARYDVVCLDEVEIDDAANEARLVTILQIIEKERISLIASSNVTPARFMTTELGTGRFTTFIQAHFQEQYEIQWVRGEDYRERETSTGTGWIGPPEATRQAMREQARRSSGKSRWLHFDELLDLTTRISHERVMDELTALENLFIEEIEVQSTDDALRLLRVIDTLYLADDAPVVHFTSAQRPHEWLAPSDSGAGREVSLKFRRTISRLRALCTLHDLHRHTSAEAPDAGAS